MKTLSFRDPLSKVYKEGSKIVRKLNSEQYYFFQELMEKSFFKEMIKNKTIQNLSLIDEGNKIMVHENIENFVETHEMAPYQLYLSGIHTLDILIKSLNSGYLIKDASAWNVVFNKGKPLFLDIGSFQKWDGNQVWHAYGQFIRHYIIPLIINRETGLTISTLFSNNIDGVDPITAKKILGIKVFKSWVNLEFIYLPSILEKKTLNKDTEKKENQDNKELNLKVILKIIERLRKKIILIEPKSKSFWLNYTNERDHYSQKDIEIKKNIFKEFINSKNGNLLDIGCNTGEFLELSFQNDNIVSYGIDNDQECINLIQKKFINKNINLSCVNLCNPQAGVGWINSETKGFINKNKLFYEIVVFFGIIHHLLVTHRIPLNEIFDLLHNFTKNYVIFEFVSNDDPKFLKLAGTNIELYKNFNKEKFEIDLKKYFKVINKYNYKDNKSRIIYILQKK